MNDVSRLSAELINPGQYIALKENKFATKILEWEQCIGALFEKKSYEIDLVAVKLESVSYQRVLDRGFALVTDSNGQSMHSITSTKPGKNINIRFSDGEITGIVVDKRKKLKKESKSK